MWTESLENGKVKFVERYKNPLTGKYGRVSVVMEKNTASTRKAALDALNAKTREKIGAANIIEEKDLTIDTLIERYLEYEKNNKPGTYYNTLHRLESIKKLLGGDTKIKALTAGYIKSKFSGKGIKPCTYNGRIVYFKAMIRWGYQNDLISDIRYLDKIKKKEDNEKREKLEEKYLEREELLNILGLIEKKHWNLLSQFLVLSGLRFGEAAALCTKDVDLVSMTIHVTKTYDSEHKVVTSPKTYDSFRDIYIQPELESVCREIVEYFPPDRDLFFYNSRGGHIQYKSYSQYLKKISKNEIDKVITPHIFRHTHVSLLAEAGVQLEVISRRLGHSNSDLTRKIYLHVTRKQKEKDREKMEKIYLL